MEISRLNYDAYVERYDEARSSLERVLRSAPATGDVWAEMWLTRSLAFVDLLEGRFPAARAGAARSLAIAESIGVPSAIAFNLAILAWLAAVEGRESEAREHAARADELAQRGLGTPCCEDGFRRRSVYSSWVSRAHWLRSRSSDRSRTWPSATACVSRASCRTRPI